MRVAKTITIEMDDLVKIEYKVKKGEINSISEFFQKAIRNELETGDK